MEIRVFRYCSMKIQGQRQRALFLPALWAHVDRLPDSVIAVAYRHCVEHEVLPRLRKAEISVTQ